MSKLSFRELGVPLENDEPVFAEPWQAQAFAMALALHQAGMFSWATWATRLSEKISEAQAAGDPDLGDTYYQHWLNTLESLCVETTGLSLGELSRRKQEWREAYICTPHGKPVLLSNCKPS